MIERLEMNSTKFLEPPSCEARRLTIPFRRQTGNRERDAGRGQTKFLLDIIKVLWNIVFPF